MSVDVLMPVHGDGKYISQTIDSFHHQSVPESKLVIILDRPDAELLGTLKKSNLNTNCRVLISPGFGIVDALNFGLLNSEADYIARIDSDDLLMEGRLIKQIQLLDNNLEIICVGTQLELIDSTGKNIGYTRYPTESEEIYKRLQYQNCIAHPSVMYRREIQGSLFLYNKVFTGAEDYDLWLRMSQVGKIINIDEKLTKYRVSEGQYSSTFRDSIREIEDLCRATLFFPTMSLDFNHQLGGEEYSKEFRLILKMKFREFPQICVRLLASHYIGQIIDKFSKKSNLFLKSISAVPFAILAFLLSPRFFIHFFVGLFKNRTIKVKK